MSKVPMTINGANKLKEELEHLKFSERPRISNAIAEARAHGDLKENAEYHAAKEQQGLVEARIRDIEYKLSRAQVIDVSTLANVDNVVFGATVHLVNVYTGAEFTYQIVGEDEADIKANKISITSPIARALIGKSVDEAIEVITPGGKVEYEITDIEYV